MVYNAKIDTAYYCDINGHYTPDGIARLRSETDRRFEEMAEMRPAVTAGVCVYKGRINEKLQERSRDAYNDIVSFIGEAAYSGTACYDEELTRFACTASIYRLEEGAVEKTIYDHIQYIEDFMGIYNEMLYLFRRILFGMPHDEGLQYIEDNQLSVFAVEQMLQDMPVGGKGEIAASMAGFYRSLGMVKEAEYLRRATEVQHG